MLQLQIHMHELNDPQPIENDRVSYTIEKYGRVEVVRAYALSRGLLDADNAVGLRVGAPEGLVRWMSDWRYCEFWCMPGFGEKFADVPPETQLLLYQKRDGSYGVLLPIVGDDYKCVLLGAEGSPDAVEARLFAWKPTHRCCSPAFAWAEGPDPYALVRLCAEAGAAATGRRSLLRDERRYPELFEYLGWCSWDSMEIEVNEQGLLEKCEEFREKKIPVRWAILDDMWADIRAFREVKYSSIPAKRELMHCGSLRDFEACPVRFPEGLESCLRKMRGSYGMKIGIWHPTTGYWFGVDPEGALFPLVKDTLIETPDGRWIPSFEQDKAYRFFSAFHDFLKKAGADFVKIDNQSMYRRFYKGLETVGSAARQEHAAIEASVGAHFDGTMINCMGMALEDWWNRPVSSVTRCSDDFQPENRAWFTKHITQCAYNSFTQGVFMWCDWDMWWTDDGQAVKNSVLRAVSGGPIYVSDKIGRSRPEILKPLCLSDGRILRCDAPASPARESLLTNPVTSPVLFKLQNTAAGSGVLAVFNLFEDGTPVSGTVSPSDVEGLDPDGEYLVWEHFSRSWLVMRWADRLDLTLGGPDDFRLYNFVRIVDGFAPLGLTEKFIAPKTITARIGRHFTVAEAGSIVWYENGQIHTLNGSQI